MWTVKTLTGGPAGPYEPVNIVPCRNVGGKKNIVVTHCTHFNKCLLMSVDLQTTPNFFSFLLSFTGYSNRIVVEHCGS